MLVRSPEMDRLAALLRGAGADVRTDDGPGSARVTGLDCAGVGDLAARHAIAVHELTLHQASLEDAFMELTHDHVDFTTKRTA